MYIQVTSERERSVKQLLSQEPKIKQTKYTKTKISQGNCNQTNKKLCDKNFKILKKFKNISEDGKISNDYGLVGSI